MATIKKECLQVWGVISSWAEAYFKTAVTGQHFLDKPIADEVEKGPFRYARVSGSALYSSSRSEKSKSVKWVKVRK